MHAQPDCRGWREEAHPPDFFMYCMHFWRTCRMARTRVWALTVAVETRLTSDYAAQSSVTALPATSPAQASSGGNPVEKAIFVRAAVPLQSKTYPGDGASISRTASGVARETASERNLVGHRSSRMAVLRRGHPLFQLVIHDTFKPLCRISICRSIRSAQEFSSRLISIGL